MGAIEDIQKSYLRTDLAEFKVGDTVIVNVRIKEGEKERLQAFEGVVIRFKKGGVNSSFTVRKISYGVGVERIFPTHAPLIESVKVKTHGKVRRARLFYLRELKGKAARIKTRK